MSNSNSEQLAQWVAESGNSQDTMSSSPPPPPKPGEYIVCQLCGRIMKPEDFSKIKRIRQYEFKWHIHYACQQIMFEQMDMMDSNANLERRENRSFSESEQETILQTQRQLEQYKYGDM